MLQSFVTEGSLRTKWKEVAPIYLDYKYTSKNVTEMTESLTKFYFGRSDPKVVAESKIAAVRNLHKETEFTRTYYFCINVCTGKKFCEISCTRFAQFTKIRMNWFNISRFCE